MDKITQLTCIRVHNIARYAAYKCTDTVIFGNRVPTIRELCEEFGDSPAQCIMVKAYAGPHGATRRYHIRLTDLVRDWYLRALASGNSYTARKMEEALL